MLLFNFPSVFAQGLTLPAGNAGIEDAVGRVVQSEPTAEELAQPPAGEIQKFYLRNVNESRSGLATVLAAVPEGGEGQQSPLFQKMQTIKAGLDQLASSRLELELFSLIPSMAEVFEAESEDVPRFVSDSIGWLQNLSPSLLHSIARHVARQNGIVAAINLTNFVKVFAAKRGFISGGDWEDEPLPINAAGVMILEASAVVNQLKAGPWQSAKQFLGGADQAGVFFARYVAAGDGLAALKTKYAQNQAAIDAKFVELKHWVAQQEAAASPP